MTTLRSCAAALGILFVVLLSSYAPFYEKKVVWMSAAQTLKIANMGQLNDFTRLKYKLINSIAPLRRWYAKRPYTIGLEATLLLAPSTFPQQNQLGEPVATNSSGVRVWIVTPPEAPSFQTKLRTEWETNSDYQLTHRYFLYTRDGISGSFISTVAAYEGTMPEKIYPATPQGEFEINVVTETTSRAYDLTVAMALFRQTFNNVIPCDTIVPCGFKIRVPKNGVLVMECGPFKDRSANPYWFVVTPSKARISYPTVGPRYTPSI